MTIRPRLLGVFLATFASVSMVQGADCNGNGNEDTADLEAGSSVDCNGNGVPDECDSEPLRFGFREGDETVEVAGTPIHAVRGDLTGDTIPDLIVGVRTEGSQSELHVYATLPGGGFAPPQTFASGSSLSDLVAGDLDGDGDLDMATANSTFVRVFLNDGSGALEAPREFPSPRTSSRVLLSDVDGDGLLDLFTSNRAVHTLSVHLNLGGGDFAEVASYDAGKLTISPVAADFDGDGDPDLAAVNERSQEVSVLLNAGDGTFGPPLLVSTETRPLSLAAGDFDQDGRPDLVVGTDMETSLWRNPGDGSFTGPSVSFPVDTAFLRSADLDGDGREDVYGGDREGRRLRIFRAVGETLAAPMTVIADYVSLVAMDVDGDRDLDLSVVSTQPEILSILFNGVSGALAVEFKAAIQDFGQEPHHAHMSDLDGDGDLDVATANGDNRSYTVFLNDGRGDLSDWATRSIELPADNVRLDFMDSGDVDGDGDVDLASGDAWQGVVRIIRNQGGGVFEGFTDWPAGRGTFQVRLADLDQDGDLDTFSAGSSDNTVTVLFNDGSGDFSERVDLEAAGQPFAVVDVDLNADGNVDFAVANRESSDLSLFLGNGDGSFQPRVEVPVDGTPRAAAVGDFNEDGVPDLVTTTQGGETTVVFLGRGDGTLVEPPAVIPMRLVPYDPVTADYNGDGHLDIAVANEENHTLSIILGNGDGTFLPAFQLENAGGRGLRFVLAGDIDRDGDVDLVGANRQSQDLTVHLNQWVDRVSSQADFTEQICTPFDFDTWSIPARQGSSIERSLKYVLPARDDANLLDGLFQNVERFPLHQEFLQTVFPDRFPSLTPDEYGRITGRRETRDYFVGVVHQLRTEAGPVFGFTVIVDESSPDQLLSLEETRAVRARLEEHFSLGPLGYFPDTNLAREAAEAWVDPGFPIYIEDSAPTVQFVPYTRAVGYGRVRILDREGFEQANESGQLSFQSILILEEAPRDIEGVIGGVITAQQQTELSHVSIRTARRNTPNAFVADAAALFAPFDGQLVRLEVTARDATMAPATLEEAEAFWAQNRPQLSQLPNLDPDFVELSTFTEIAAMDRTLAQEPRFGGKATNLARLAGLVTGTEFEKFRESGFAIPVHYYLQFLRSNRMPSALDPAREVTYEEHLRELFTWEEFQTDSTVRFQTLDAFREFARDNGVVDSTLVDAIVSQIVAVFPSRSTPLRFRSSSNVEDALEFNGAGLYESTGGCAEDELDDDDDGPSICDPSKNGERDLRRALKKVWTSVYTFRAFEERAFYGIPEDLVGMGILVSRAFPDEIANGVAFTGNLANAADRRFVVTAQVGEESVVSPDPGVLPEKDLLEIADAEVVRIIRPTQGSTLLEPGVWVLSEDQLREIGRFLAFVDTNFPIDLGTHRREEVLLDLEFKLEPDESLAFKQIRPFLLTEPPPPAPTFELQIPEGLVICANFAEAGAGRGVREEYLRKCQIHLRGGTLALPTVTDRFEAEIFDQVFFGPDQQVAVPEAPGTFRVLAFPGAGGLTIYRFTYEQPFVLPDGRRLDLGIFAPIVFSAEGSESREPPRVLDDAFFTAKPGDEALGGSLDGDPVLQFGSCTNESLPLIEVVAELEDGTTLRLEERFLEESNLFETGAASLQRADVSIAGGQRVVTEYWDLVYSAGRHNSFVEYWVVLDPPVVVDGLTAPVAIVELALAEPSLGRDQPSAAYLSADLEVLRTLSVSSLERGGVSEQPNRFLRGDVQANSGVDLADALSLLNYVLQRGAPPSCPKAADANDDGRINLVDGIVILTHTFADGGPLPEPFSACGEDPSLDTLSCDSFAPCAP